MALMPGKNYRTRYRRRGLCVLFVVLPAMALTGGNLLVLALLGGGLMLDDFFDT